MEGLFQVLIAGNFVILLIVILILSKIFIEIDDDNWPEV